MFSGQGSQYFNMGKELYENNPRFRLWMNHCDEIARSYLDTSLIDIIYQSRSKNEQFDRILHTNPALLCVQYSLARLLMELGLKPDFLLGYSLGEFTASVIAGAVPLDDAIQFTINFARLLEKESPLASMLAIIDSEKIIDRDPEVFEGCFVTGRNFNRNFVISGLFENIGHTQKLLDEKQIIHQKLPVNYAFHTDLMEPLKESFMAIAKKMSYSPIKIPIISSLKEQIQFVDENYLWNVIRYPVEFEGSISNMQTRGDYIFIDVGPSGTLATFIKYILPDESSSLYFETINQFGKNLLSMEKLTSGIALAINKDMAGTY